MGRQHGDQIIQIPSRIEDALDPALPFGRQGTAWEVAYATLFLLSTESSYVNGQVLIADGGLSIGAARALVEGAT